MSGMMKDELSKTWRSRLGYSLARPAFESFRRRVDYREYGAAPLLGVEAGCFIGHGRSNPRAIRNSIRAVRWSSVKPTSTTRSANGSPSSTARRERLLEDSPARGDLCHLAEAVRWSGRPRCDRAREGTSEPRLDAMTADIQPLTRRFRLSPARARSPSAWGRTWVEAQPQRQSRSSIEPIRALGVPLKQLCLGRAGRGAAADGQHAAGDPGDIRGDSRSDIGSTLSSRCMVAGHSLGEYSAHVAAGTSDLRGRAAAGPSSGRADASRRSPSGEGPWPQCLGLEAESVSCDRRRGRGRRGLRRRQLQRTDPDGAGRRSTVGRREGRLRLAKEQAAPGAPCSCRSRHRFIRL